MRNRTYSEPIRRRSDAIRRAIRDEINGTQSHLIRRKVVINGTQSHLLARLEGASRRQDRSAFFAIELPGLLDARLLPSGYAY